MLIRETKTATVSEAMQVKRFLEETHASFTQLVVTFLVVLALIGVAGAYAWSKLDLSIHRAAQDSQIRSVETQREIERLTITTDELSREVLRRCR